MGHIRILFVILILATSLSCKNGESPPDACLHQYSVSYWVNARGIDENPQKFNSCSELKKYVDDMHEYVGSYSHSSCRDYSAVSVGADSGRQPTNVQVAGVGEADIIKRIGGLLVIVSGQKVYMIDASHRSIQQTLNKFEFHNIQLMVDDNQLFIIESEKYGTRSKIHSYELRKGRLSLKSTQNFSGKLQAVRKTNNKLIVISRQDARNLDDSNIACDQIYKPMATMAGPYLYQVYSLKLGGKDNPFELIHSQLQELGQSYVTSENVYLGESHYFNWNYNGESRSNFSAIRQIDLNFKGLSRTAILPGKIRDQWNFNEDFDSKTLYLFTENNFSNVSSNLFSLDFDGEDLVEQASIEKFGSGENLRGIRFHKNYAYAVTFRMVDPLHIFDLTHPDSPTLVGHLEVPGFSSYLHPLGQSQLFGVGTQSGKLQLSLFNVKDPVTPFAVDQIYLPKSYAYYTGQDAHHRIFVDENTKRAGVSFYGQTKSGYNSKIVLVNLQDQIQIMAQYIDAIRMMSEAGQYIILGENSLKFYSIHQPKVLQAQIKF